MGKTTPQEGTREDELDKILYHYAVQRDMYYSDLKDGVIEDAEWAAIRDKIQLTTKEALSAYTNREVIKELYELIDDKDNRSHGYTGIKVTRIKDRIAELRGKDG